MTEINGGLIKKVFNFPRRVDCFAIIGVWSGGEWATKAPFLVQQYKGRRLAGAWRVVGIEMPNRMNIDPILLMEPHKISEPLEAGDILIFQKGFFTHLPVIQSNFTINRDTAVEFGQDKLKAITVNEDSVLKGLFIFHGREDRISYQSAQEIWWKDKLFTVDVDLGSILDVDYQVKFCLKRSDVTMKMLIETLQPIRSFTLDAGQEMFTSVPRTSHGRHLKSINENFEPVLRVANGSVVVILQPPKPSQLPLFVNAAEPLRLTAEAIMYAAQGNSELLLTLLSDNLLSIDTFLRHLQRLGRAAEKSGALVMSNSTSSETWEIGTVFLSTINMSIKPIEIRTETREALLYAVDTMRGWCRIVADTTGYKEDWTLTFESDLSERVKGEIPRMVRAVFNTKSRPGVRRGSGTLLNID